MQTTAEKPTEVDVRIEDWRRRLEEIAEELDYQVDSDRWGAIYVCRGAADALESLTVEPPGGLYECVIGTWGDVLELAARDLKADLSDDGVRAAAAIRAIVQEWWSAMNELDHPKARTERHSVRPAIPSGSWWAMSSDALNEVDGAVEDHVAVLRTVRALFSARMDQERGLSFEEVYDIDRTLRSASDGLKGAVEGWYCRRRETVAAGGADARPPLEVSHA